MADELRRTYLRLLIPSIIGFMCFFLAKNVHPVGFDAIKHREYLAPVVFILSVLFAIALPIFFRALFAHRAQGLKGVSRKNFMKFERTLLAIALVTPYMTLTAYLLALPRFYCAGTVLMALYAVYYYYPSQRRIEFERRIFRVG